MVKFFMTHKILRAGVSIADISPAPGVGLGGYPYFERRNTGVHDPLFASALVLDDGMETIAIVCMDLLFISRERVQSVRRRVEKASGVPADHNLRVAPRLEIKQGIGLRENAGGYTCSF